jgi:hypothetical protein
MELDGNNTASFDIRNMEYNGYELTEIFFIQFYTPNGTDDYNCEEIQKKGEQRTAYLVNRTRE